LQNKFCNVLDSLRADVLGFPLEECQAPLTVGFMVT
jgi:hypothetical protein